VESNWSDTWQLRTQLYGFFGNSLLKIMTAETAIGLNPAFWKEFPLKPEADGHIATALPDLIACAQSLANKTDAAEALEKVGTEYTRLFIGPGKPAAPPWETLYREGGTVLFGQPTFEMKKLLAREGVKASKESHQFEDHIGFELLYLGMRGADYAKNPPSSATITELQVFIEAHPLSFIEQFYAKAHEAATIGFYPALIELIWGFLLWDLALLDEYQRI
jgi:TorA maturation chaperone TorD